MFILKIKNKPPLPLLKKEEKQLRYPVIDPFKGLGLIEFNITLVMKFLNFLFFLCFFIVACTAKRFIYIHFA